MNRAQDWGFRCFVMLNAYAYRATDPKDMKAHSEPVGKDNDNWIIKSCESADRIVCCWGNHAQHLNRSSVLLKLLKKYTLHRMGEPTSAGEPRHPLYLPKNIALQEI